MEFTIPSDILSSYVNLVSRVVSSKSNLPVLNNILLNVQKEKLVVTGTDLEVQISASFPLTALEEGNTTVNAKIFSQYINTLSKDEKVHLKLTKNKLAVETSKSAAEFTTKDPADFPLFEQEENVLLFELPVETFANMIDKTVFACAKDDIRPVLTGVHFEVDPQAVTMVALDIYRLSKISTKGTSPGVDKKEFVVSGVALENVNRIIRDPFISSIIQQNTVKVYLAKANNYAVFEYGDICLFARLLEGDYPEYKSIIPTAYQLESKVNRAQWLEALKRVAVFAQSAISQKVTLTFKGSSLIMESFVAEIGQVREEIQVENEGEELQIAFQAKFLAEILNLMDDEVIIFRTINKTTPGIFLQPSLETFIHLLMPLKLDE